MATRFPLDPLPGLPTGTLRALLPPELFAVRHFVPEREDEGDDEYDAYGDYDPLPEPYDVDPAPVLVAHADEPIESQPLDVLLQLFDVDGAGPIVASHLVEAVWRTPALLAQPSNLHRLAWNAGDSARPRLAAAQARHDAAAQAGRVAASSAQDGVFFQL